MTETTIGEAAAHVGVSVRTLHHWESLGLLATGRTDSGYRTYSDDDLTRLRRISFYRGLGVPLAEIGELLADGTVDTTAALERRREQLAADLARTEQALNAVDRALDAITSGAVLTAQERPDVLGPHWNPDRAQQAAHRWGHTLQWRQHAERAAERTPDDWRALIRRTEEFEHDLVDAHRSGLAPDAPAAHALAERHRQQLAVYFDCTPAMQVCLARSFVHGTRSDDDFADQDFADQDFADQGFADHYESLAPGLGRWFREVIDADARAHGLDPTTASWD